MELFHEWNMALLDYPIKIAVVWPRVMSTYAKKVLDVLFAVLKRYEWVCVISGGAEGVDEYAHMCAIQAGIWTVMVLWWGIWRYKQSTKRELVEKILLADWLLLSEYEYEETPKKYTYPQRNRIIANSSDLVFLPEAWEKSGALITVQYANKAWIPVCAPMQDIFNVHSLGSNRGIVAGKIKPIIDLEQMLATYFGPSNFMWSLKNDSQSHSFSDSVVSAERNNFWKIQSTQDVLVEEMRKRLGL